MESFSRCLRTCNLPMKTNFELTPLDSHSAYCKNLLAMLVSTLVKHIWKEIYLPKYLVVILDDDLIRWLKFEDFGISEVMGRTIKWLAYQIDRVIKAQINYLPKKAIRYKQPQVIWIGASNHHDFANNVTRKKFNDCISSIVDIFPNMKILKPIKGWDYNNHRLVAKNGQRLSGFGIEKFWMAVDSAIQFWDENRNNPINNSTHITTDLKSFKKFTKTQRNDRFHWNNNYNK